MRGKVTIIAFVAVLALFMSVVFSYAGTTELISHSPSDEPSISGDGRYVAYVTSGSFLYGGGRVYVRDRSNDELTNISFGYDGSPANKVSKMPSVNCNGRYLVFVSLASNLVPGDNNRTYDVFVHNLQTGEKVLVSVNSNGQQGNGTSYSLPDISCDGRYVAFMSYASNLVPGDTNGKSDIFVHDRDADENGIFDEPGGISTERVSVSSEGNQGNNYSGASGKLSISDDGRYIGFTSDANNLVPGDINGEEDAFVHDRLTGETELVSLDEDGNQLTWHPPYVKGILGAHGVTISGDGRYVSFSWFYDHTMYVYDRDTSTSINMGYSYPTNFNYSPSSFNSDGRLLAWNCGQYSCVYDMLQGTNEIVSISNDGIPIHSWKGDISSDGRYVAFEGVHTGHVYVRDRGPKNASPAANAGADITVECAGPQGATVTLDGSGSTDPDGDELTYTWTGTFGTATGVNATVTLPLGTHTVTLTVDDGNSGIDTDDVVITVADTTPPVITIFGVSDGETYTLALVPEASYDVMDTCSGVASSSALLMGGGNVCFDSFTYKVTATDNAGNEGTETAAYEVIATADTLIALIHQMVLDGLIAPQMENSLVSQVQNGALKA